MPRYKVECRGCKASWFVTKRRKLEPEQKKQLVWRSRCRPCGVELSAPKMFPRTGELFYSDRHRREFREYVAKLRSGELRHTFSGQKTYEQIGREDYEQDLERLRRYESTDPERYRNLEMRWRMAAVAAAFAEAGLSPLPEIPHKFPPDGTAWYQSWSGTKFCSHCWNYNHALCAGSECQCPHVKDKDADSDDN